MKWTSYKNTFFKLYKRLKLQLFSCIYSNGAHILNILLIYKVCDICMHLQVTNSRWFLYTINWMWTTLKKHFGIKSIIFLKKKKLRQVPCLFYNAWSSLISYFYSIHTFYYLLIWYFRRYKYSWREQDGMCKCITI